MSRKLIIALALALTPTLAEAARHEPKPHHKTASVARHAPVRAAPVVLPDPPTPVVQARKIGLTACVPVMSKMAKETLTANYAVQSAWNRTNPANHSFQSVAVLNKPDNLPPDGLAALVVTPLANGTCDGVTLQVFPLAGTCPAVQSVILSSGGRILGPLLNSRVMIDAAGKRLILLPGFNNTCMAISVHTTYGAP